jgi:renalase
MRMPQSTLRVGIVGAGVAGLAAARVLQKAGHHSVVFERLGRVGGRVASQRLGEFVFDTGATSIAPRGLAIEEVMLRELDPSGLVSIEKPISVHHNLRVNPGDALKNATPRFVYRQGIDRLPQLLAEGLDVRLETAIESILPVSSGGYEILGDRFDALVLTPPVPISSALLWTLADSRSTGNCRYRSCLSVLLGYRKEAPTQAYHALLDPEQRHPLIWLSLESVKSPERAPEVGAALVAQFNPAFSLINFEKPDEAIVETAAGFLVRLYGAEWSAPDESAVVRWKYSQPEGLALFDSVNPPGSDVLLAGDGVMGGRVEQAFESGVLAARRLIEERK